MSDIDAKPEGENGIDKHVAGLRQAATMLRCLEAVGQYEPDLSMEEISFLFEVVATARRFIEASIEELLAYVRRQGGVS